MGKKKSGKKGSKKKGKGDDDKADKAIAQLKVLYQGYQKRCEKYHGQPPIEFADVEMKKATKSGENITQLVFAEQDLEGPSGSSKLIPLLEAFRETGYKALRTVYFWNTEMRNEDMLVLGMHLEKKADITTMEFLDNDLSAFGCESLGRSLSFNMALTSLTIKHNDIGDDGCIALCKGLAFNKVLSHLVLDYCGIGVDGAVALGRGIGSSASWNELLLNGNHIGSVGACRLTEHLNFNKILKRIELRDCHIDRYAGDGENCIAFLESLETSMATNTTLSYLDLFDNTIGDEGAEAVLALHAKRKEAGLSSINIRVDTRMRAETYASIAKVTKWSEASGAGGGGGGGKKKAGKKKGKGKKKKK
eukprot:m.73172 g.73172  ORF g.73172 m.73172 type:complete len:362 (+) comp12387_c0_seq6:67-1152(+)